MTVDDAAHRLLAPGSPAATGTRLLLADLAAGAQRLLLDGTVSPDDVTTATALVELRDAVATLVAAFDPAPDTALDPAPGPTPASVVRDGTGTAAAAVSDPGEADRRLRVLLGGVGTVPTVGEAADGLDGPRLAELGRLAVLTLSERRGAGLARDLAATGVPPDPPVGIGEQAFEKVLRSALPAEVTELAVVADEILGLLSRCTGAFSAHSMLTSQVRALTPVPSAVEDYRIKVVRRLDREPSDRNVRVVDEALRSAFPWPPPHPTSWWARELERASEIVRKHAADTGQPWSVPDPSIGYDKPVDDVTVLTFLLDDHGRDVWWRLSVGTPDEKGRYLRLQGR